jgi:amino acid transporter
MVNTKTLTTTSIVFIIVAIAVSFFSMFIPALFIVTGLLIIASTVLSIISWVKSEKGSNLREIIVACISILLLILLVFSIIGAAPRPRNFTPSCNVMGGICQATCENGDIPNGLCTVKGQQCCRVFAASG